TRRAGYPVDLDNPRCSGRPPSPSGRPPGARGRPQLPSSYPLVDRPLPSTRTVSCCRRAPFIDRCSLLRSTDCSVDLPVELPLLVDGPPIAQTSQLQLSSSLVDSNTTAVPCSSTKPVEQLSHCGRSAATPVHLTKSSALSKGVPADNTLLYSTSPPSQQPLPQSLPSPVSSSQLPQQPSLPPQLATVDFGAAAAGGVGFGGADSRGADSGGAGFGGATKGGAG
ncbi:unnamed protein product, partial [Closterium sp. NIES-53]